MSSPRRVPQPTALVAAVPPSTPFVAPEELARRFGRERLLRLGANESAFGPSPRAIGAMREAVGLTSWYGDPESLELRAALAARHGCAVDELVVACGIDDLMGLIVRAFCAPGDACVATRGTYPTLFYHLAGFGARAEFAEPNASGGIVPESIAAAVQRSGAKLVYVANPDNPSGAFVDRATLSALREALPGDVLLFLDEAYADFVPRDALPADAIDPRTIRARTFSKAYGMAGARIGYMIATKRNVDTFQKIRLHYGVNRNAQIGAVAALADTAFHASVVRQVAEGRAGYYALAGSIGRKYLESSTNFVCIDFDTNERATALMNGLLSRGVFVRKPAAAPLDRYVRISVGTPEERSEFTRRLHAVMEELDK